MREAHFGDRPVLILREPKPAPPTTHKCVVEHGNMTSATNIGAIIQCDCGKRYKCRQSWALDSHGVWVRRFLPWPPRVKGWPKEAA